MKPPLTDSELLDRMQRHPSPTAALLGLRPLAVDRTAGTVTLECAVTPPLCNPMGSLQGGMIAAILDDAAALAILVTAARRIGLPTIEMKVSFFATAPSGSRVVATGRCVKLGRTVAFAEADLHDTGGRLLARLSCSTLPVDFTAPPQTAAPETPA